MTGSQATRRDARTLGRLVVGLACAQLALYAAALAPRMHDLAFYLDPRIGLHYLESNFSGRNQFPGVSCWISAVVLLAMGLLLVRSRARITTYLLLEMVMAIPSALFFLMVVWANISPSHGFSIAELLLPLPVFAAFTLFPLVWAARLWEAST